MRLINTRTNRRTSESPSHDFPRLWCARSSALRSSLGPSALGLFGMFGLFQGVFALFNFLSCLYTVPLPKILASRLVASLKNKHKEGIFDSQELF